MEPFKNLFNPTLFRSLADKIKTAWPPLDADGFVRELSLDIDALELKERITRMAVVSRTYLPREYREAVEVLRKTASGLGTDKTGLFTLFMPEFVARYGIDDVAYSLDALKFFTRFGSSEFAVRPFLLRHFEPTIAAMKEWSRDANEHVRRLASEGSRPRLPWGERLPMVIRDPALTLPILERLKSDESEYVRKSVANHLNDISKDHPDWMLDLVEKWDRSQPGIAWIVKHACRGLIKAGNGRALSLFGSSGSEGISIENLKIEPREVAIGGRAEITFTVVNTNQVDKKLTIDYAVLYARPSGKPSRKVFKLKTVELPAGARQAIRKQQHFIDVSIRTHFPGPHGIEIQVNGAVLARGEVEVVSAAVGR